MHKSEKFVPLQIVHRLLNSREESTVAPRSGVNPLPDVKALLETLPPLDEEPAGTPEAEILPHQLPLPEQTVELSFETRSDSPPAPSPSYEKPELTGITPEGAPGLFASHPSEIRITYSAPAVALGAIDQTPVPNIALSPPIEGSWMWDSPTQLVFQPHHSFPKATDFTLTLEDGKIHRFSTERPRPTTSPGTLQHRDAALKPELSIGFNMAMDRQSVLEHLTLTTEPPSNLESYEPQVVSAADQFKKEGRTGETFPIVLLPPEENDPLRLLRFTTEGELPKDTMLYVKAAPGIKSPEGPLTSTDATWFAFKTYGPPAFRELTGEPRYLFGVPQKVGYHLHFNNRLESYGEVVVEPPGLTSVRSEQDGIFAHCESSTIYLEGALDPGDYEITIRDMKDVHGHTLEEVSTKLSVPPGEPEILAPTNRMLTLPAGQATFPVHALHTSKLEIHIHRVDPFNDFTRFQRYCHGFEKSGFTKASKSAPEILSVEVDSPQVSLDLAPFLNSEGVGHLVLEMRPWREAPPASALAEPENTEEFFITVWVQVTHLDIGAFSNEENLDVLVVNGSCGRVVDDAETVLFGGESFQSESRTDQNGWSRLETGDHQNELTLLATQNEDTTLLPLPRSQSGYYLSEYHAYPMVQDGSELETTVYAWTDRGLYRPGERVAVKGWIRQRKFHRGRLSLPLEKQLNYTLTSSGKTLGEGRVELSINGTFDLTITLPEEARYGHDTFRFGSTNCSLSFELGERYRSRLDFQVEEFRPPEFEVIANSDQGSALRGDTVQMRVKAAYFSGGGLSGAPVEWRTTARTTNYVPPGRSDFLFGRWKPQWWSWFFEEKEQKNVSQATTDSSGEAHLALELKEGEIDQTYLVETQAFVTDLNNQQWVASSRALVHSSNLSVGLRTQSFLLAPGSWFEVEVLVTNTGGDIVPGTQVEVRCQDQVREVISSSEPVAVEFQHDGGGQTLVEAVVRDSIGRTSRTTIPLWSWGGAVRRPDTEKVLLIPDKEAYSVGETATFLIISSFSEAAGLFRVGSERPFYESRFKLSGGKSRLEVPISEEMIPLSTARVDLLSLDSFGHAHGSLEVEVQSKYHRVTVQVTPETREATPDSKNAVLVEVTDSDGTPVAEAEVAVVVVDEAVLFLGKHKIPDPLQIFYPRQVRPLTQTLLHNTRVIPTRDDLVKERLEEMESLMMYDLADSVAGDPDPSSSPNYPRHDFASLAHFEATASTDSEGRVRIPFTLPSNLTRYRVTAVVSEGPSKFGYGESSIKTDLPLMVRPSPPRFLVVGDLFDLPVLVQNGTSSSQTVRVALKAVGLALQSSGGFEVELQPGERQDINFSVEVEDVEKATFAVIAQSREYDDSVRGEVPVVRVSVMESAASYGHLDQGAARLPLKIPRSEHGGFSLSLSTTALANLEPALEYLFHYPYQCAEQRASRILGLVASIPYLEAFDCQLPRGEKLKHLIGSEIDALIGQQQFHGGWGFWSRSRVNPWVSAHAAHALWSAREAGYPVNSKVLETAAEFLTHWDLDEEMPPTFEWSARAYSLWVLTKLQPQVSQRKEARELCLKEDLPLEALGWLLPLLKVLKKECAESLRRIRNSLSETSSKAHSTGIGTDALSWILGSARRQDAIFLNTFMEFAPDDPLVVKLVNGLLAHREGGRWANTQENIFALLALLQYFKKYEKWEPDLVARAWLGEKPVLEESFLGRSKDTRSLHLPMSFLRAEDPDSVTLSHQGHGRLYYRAALNYEADSPEESLFHGFRVFREYSSPNEGEVTKEDGAWRIRAGSLVTVHLQLQSTRRHHVALVDRLPAGFEPLPPNRQPSLKHGYQWEHYEFKDREARLFSGRLDGATLATYQVRATTKGSFVAPPCTVEEMYHPETFGRTGVERVVVV